MICIEKNIRYHGTKLPINHNKGFDDEQQRKDKSI